MSGWVWVGAGSRSAGLRTGRAILGLRRTRPCRSGRTRAEGREDAVLPKPSFLKRKSGTAGPDLKRKEAGQRLAAVLTFFA
jgi:hypothetical protein